MVDITSRTILDQFRNELDSRDLSRRQIQRLVKVPIRHKLREGNEEQVVLDHFLKAMDAAKVDKAEFFARVAGVGKLSLTVFGSPQKVHWTQQQRKILNQVGEVEERGDAGFAEARAELRRIELLRDNDPKAAEAAAWDFLDRHRAPGALVGALAILAVEAPRPNALRLFSMAFELLGPKLQTAAGGKLATAMGRNLFMAGQFNESLQVLQMHALPVVALFGTQEEHALLAYYIGICASNVGEAALSRKALEKVLEIGGERLRFAVLQRLALEELNLGNLQKAATMYDELVAMPYFGQAENRAKAIVTWSRLTARFLAGQLDASAEPEFREAIEGARILDARSQVAAVLDLALFLASIGKAEAAGELLKAEQWNVLGLEDGEVPQKFVTIWESLGLPKETCEYGCLARRNPAAPSLVLGGISRS
jgi:hypothetical protein